MRFHSLDGLRAVAATVIVVYHLGLASLADKFTQGGHEVWGRLLAGLGSSGVELFFTLSGVVLLRPYLRGGRPMRVADYVRRRVMRLWPPFLAAWLLAGATVALLAAYPTWWPSAMPAFSWAGWLQQVGLVYTGQGAYNFAWWSLTVEVIFYAAAPFIVLTVAGGSRAMLAAVGSVAVVVAQAAFMVGGEWGLPRVAVQFLGFLSCFAGGVFLAAYDVDRRTALALGAAGAAVVASTALSPAVNGHVGYGLIYLAVVSLAMDESAPMGRALSRPAMIWLGERSYSLFLTHYSVIALACWATAQLVDGKGLAFFAISRGVAVVGSLVVACAVFEWVERHFAHGLVTAGQWRPRLSDGPSDRTVIQGLRKSRSS